LPSEEALDPCIEFIRNTKAPSNEEIAGISLEIKFVNTEQLYHAEKWDPVFWNLENPQILAVLYGSPNLVPLADSKEFTFVAGFHSTHCDSLIIPNHLFRVAEDLGEEGILVERLADGKKVFIPQYFLRPCLREPKLYQEIYADPGHWVLSIGRTDALPDDFAENYLKYAQDLLACQVRKKFKKGGKVRETLDQFWYTHPHDTGCDTKIGHLWTFNRYGLWLRKNAAVYTEQEVTANDGFHVYHYVGSEIAEDEALKILNSWYNCSLHLFDFLQKCRVPATHVQQSLKPDRTHMFVPIVTNLSPLERELILQSTQEYADSVDGTILEQLALGPVGPRRKLDEAWLKCLHVDLNRADELLDTSYKILAHIIQAR
jgi:hypothetical protein